MILNINKQLNVIEKNKEKENIKGGVIYIVEAQNIK